MDPSERSRDVALDEITSRWRAHGTVALHSHPASLVAPAPDIRSSFLRLRADLLAKEKRLGTAPTAEDELADTLEELLKERADNQQLRIDNSALKDELDETKKSLESKKYALEKSEAELMELRADVKAKEEQLARLTTAARRASAGGIRATARSPVRAASGVNFSPAPNPTSRSPLRRVPFK